MPALDGPRHGCQTLLNSKSGGEMQTSTLVGFALADQADNETALFDRFSHLE